MHLILTIALIAGTDINRLCDRAEFLFFNRHLAPGNLDSAYNLLAQGRKLAPNHERCLYLWSRIHTQLGDAAPTRAEKFRYYERAMAIAETLKAINDRNPDGHMWWAVAYGRIGQERGVMNSLFMVPTLRREFHRVLELDSNYATAYDALGVMYYELPGIAGGDLGKSAEFLRRGIALDPNYTLLRLDLAKVYIRQHRWSAAAEQLNILIATKNPTYPADFVLDDKPAALELLKTLESESASPRAQPSTP